MRFPVRREAVNAMLLANEILGNHRHKLHKVGRAIAAPLRDGWCRLDAHREGRCYISHSDELLDAFLELEAMLL
jgi:hypothetical protein